MQSTPRPNGHPSLNTSKIISISTGFLTLSLALFSFILSFTALKELAKENGVSIPWLLPFLVEFGVITFSLSAMYRSVNGESAKWQWSLVIGSSLVAGIFNVAHAEAELLARVIAAMPSIFLLASFETFLSQVKYQFKRQAVVNNLDKLTSDFTSKEEILDRQIERMRDSLRQRFKSERAKLTATLAEAKAETDRHRQHQAEAEADAERLNEKVKSLKAEIKNLQSERRKERGGTPTETSDATKAAAAAILAERPDISGADLGRELGRSGSLGRRLKRELTPVGGTNGNGAEQ